MIKELKLVNFRNFSEVKFDNFEKENFIVWENWKWKTNILEALSQITNNSVIKLNLDNLIKDWENYFFIEIKTLENDIFSFYYDKNQKKKNFMLNNKKISKKFFFDNSFASVVFSPISMNILYLSPSLRRDFLDETLKSAYGEYDSLLKEYKKILKSRNLLLKAINEEKAQKSEITFWDEKFVNISVEIYKYRIDLVNFLEKSIPNIIDCFSWKNKYLNLNYITKVEISDIRNSIKSYLEKNFERDIVLQKTHIWPHIDDFEINVDWINVVNFASRGEIKSIILYLKLLEASFIENKKMKKPLIIIDDLISELDEEHKKLLLNKIKPYQTFISSIYQEENIFYIKV